MARQTKDMDASVTLSVGSKMPVFHAMVRSIRFAISSDEPELAITDLSLVELRLERIAQEQKKKPESERAEERACCRRSSHIEIGNITQHLHAEPSSRRSLAPVPHTEEHGDGDHLRRVELSQPAIARTAQAKIPGPGTRSARLASNWNPKLHRLEIRRRAEFLEALGIEEPAVNVLTRLLYKALGYICFFTVGEDEVRAWTIRRGGRP